MRDDSLVAVADFYSGRADFPLRELQPGAVVVAASDKRYKEASGCLLWMGVLNDRCLISTQHELLGPVKKVVARVSSPHQLLRTELRDSLLTACSEALAGSDTHMIYFGLKLACDGETLVRVEDHHVRKVTPEIAPEVTASLSQEGVPDDVEYMLADDAAFAYYTDGQPVSFAGTHPLGGGGLKVGNVMVATLEPYRRRGFAKAVVSATTARLLEQGKVAVYGTSDDNIPSIRTALSVGYRPYCRVLEVRFADG
jgi:GNAT superfamily N-acetyltransferase